MGKTILDIIDTKSFVIKDFYQRHLGNILIGILLFYLISSLFHKIVNFIYRENFIHPITSSIKLVILLFFIGILIVNYNKKKSLFFYLGLLLTVFVFANIKLMLSKNSDFNFYSSLVGGNLFYFIKYLYPFIFLGAFSLVKNKQKTIDRYFGILEKVLILNGIFVFMGFLFSIDFFQSYPHSNRFGYCGILERLFFAYFSMIVILRKVFLDKIDLKLLFLSLVVLFSGMKIIFLFFILLTIFYLYEKRKIKVLYFLSFFIILGIIFFKPIINFAIKIFPFWQPILNKYGYLTVLFSTRDLAFQKTLNYIMIEGNLYNLSLGFVKFPNYYTEMDIIDLFLFFGFIGAGVYLTLLSKIINKYYHFIPLIASFFAGGLLSGTIIIGAYFLWMYESHTEQKGLF